MKVSVIIPCYNVAGHVEAAVRSVWGQTHTDLELVVVDDGSDDGTTDVLERLERDAAGPLHVVRGAHAGASAARNKGLALVTGTYVQFLDADDVLLPGKIARQVALALREGDPELVVGAYRNRFEDGREETVTVHGGDAWDALIRTQLGTTSANLWQRQAVWAAGGWSEALGSSQDYELMFRMLQAGARVAWDAEPGCIVLKRARGSISRTGERDNWVRYLELRRRMRDHVKGLPAPVGERLAAVADQYLFMAIRVLAKHDLAAAFSEFDRSLDPRFAPEVSKATSPSYVKLYRALGFRAAERAAHWLAGLRTQRTAVA